MLPILAALLAASGPAPAAHAPVPGRTAWIVATVEQSEWCPAGNVRLDLGTGRYQATAGAPRNICRDPRLERPVRVGVLEGRGLARVRAAYLRALAEGLEQQICLNGGQPDQIVISNAGTPVLLVTDGARTRSAPRDLSCWTEAAGALHAVLEDLFSPTRRP